MFLGYLGPYMATENTLNRFMLYVEPRLGELDPFRLKPVTKRKIVHVRDLRDICETELGTHIVRRLTALVQRRRRSGEEIVIVGTTLMSC